MFYFYNCPANSMRALLDGHLKIKAAGFRARPSRRYYKFMKGLQFIMKYLNQFLKFAADPFFKGKVLTVTGLREWVDYTSKAKMGWCVDVVIIADATPYKTKNGETGSNLYEKLTLKMASKPSVAIGDTVEPIDPECTIYGEFRNMLSVKCSGVRVAPAAGKDKV